MEEREESRTVSASAGSPVSLASLLLLRFRAIQSLSKPSKPYATPTQAMNLFLNVMKWFVEKMNSWGSGGLWLHARAPACWVHERLCVYFAKLLKMRTTSGEKTSHCKCIKLEHQCFKYTLANCSRLVLQVIKQRHNSCQPRYFGSQFVRRKQNQSIK